VQEFAREETPVSEATPRFEAPREETFAAAEPRREQFRPSAPEPITEREPAELEPMGQSRPMIAAERPVETERPAAAERIVAPEPAPAPRPPVERPAQPAWKMEPVALPPDMVMIETQNKPPTSVYEDQAPPPVRTPRQRPQQPVVADEPLQQVETGGRPSGSNDTA